MKIIKEIAAIGILNWLWFVVFHRRNEFHPRLDYLRNLSEFSIKDRMIRRQRAHYIDECLTKLRKEKP